MTKYHVTIESTKTTTSIWEVEADGSGITTGPIINELKELEAEQTAIAAYFKDDNCGRQIGRKMKHKGCLTIASIVAID